jgi:hypothetical protein
MDLSVRRFFVEAGAISSSPSAVPGSSGHAASSPSAVPGSSGQAAFSSAVPGPVGQAAFSPSAVPGPVGQAATPAQEMFGSKLILLGQSFDSSKLFSKKNLKQNSRTMCAAEHSSTRFCKAVSGYQASSPGHQASSPFLHTQAAWSRWRRSLGGCHVVAYIYYCIVRYSIMARV